MGCWDVRAPDPSLPEPARISAERRLLRPPGQRGAALLSQGPMWHFLPSMPQGVPGPGRPNWNLHFRVGKHGDPGWKLPVAPPPRTRWRRRRRRRRRRRGWGSWSHCHSLQIRLASKYRGSAGYQFGFQGNRRSFKYNNTLKLKLEWNNNDRVHSHMLLQLLCPLGGSTGEHGGQSNTIYKSICCSISQYVFGCRKIPLLKDQLKSIIGQISNFKNHS